MLISTSILKIQNDLEKIKKIDQSSTDYIHFDVMDGQFVPAKTEYPDLSFLQKPIDLHLMVQDVKSYVLNYQSLHPVYITFPYEKHDHLLDLISFVRKYAKVGIAISPKTGVEVLRPYIDQIDLVLVMSVEPGKGGQPFQKEVLQKLDTLKEWQKQFSFVIEMDGGINEETISLCRGIDFAVVGSFITDFEDPEEQISKIKKAN